MTPGARVAAAIEVLDAVLAGAPAEKVLTTWARQNRYAGSGDRAAVRDHVFGALRRMRSAAWAGGAETGRGLMLGALRLDGQDPATLFTGEGHAPPPIADEAGRVPEEAPLPVRLDVPDWLWPRMQESLGEAAAPVLEALRHRAPVFLRVNAARTDREAARAALAGEEIDTEPHPLAETALEVTRNPRRVQASAAFRDGLVELQDASSQAICAALPAGPGQRVLDYCAGGGGKALALAARGAQVTAHDADPGRMRDLPARAARAGARVEIAGHPEGPFDLVLCDAPCSGSGTWRRAPEAKWRLTPERLAELTALQAEILDAAAPLVGPGGALAYATCSLLEEENGAQVAEFLGRHGGWSLEEQRRLTALEGGDGFFLAVLRRH